MKIKVLLSTIFVLSAVWVFGQSQGICTTVETPLSEYDLNPLIESAAGCNPDADLINAPGFYDNRTYDNLKVNMTFVIVQGTNGVSRFHDNYLQDKADMEAIISSCNGYWKNSGLAPSIPNPNPSFKGGVEFTINDPLIEFKLYDVIYISRTDRSNISPENFYDQFVPQNIKDNSLVTIMADDSVMTPSLTNSTITGGRYEYPIVYMANWTKNNHWFPDLLIHEFGHSFGLRHTFDINSWGDGDETSDTPIDIYAESAAVCSPFPKECACPPTSPFPAPYNTTCPNNFMGYDSKVYFSPRQIGKIRKSLLGFHSYAVVIGSSPVPAPPTWTNITTNTTWVGFNRVSNLRVTAGNTLIIEDFCQISENSVIEVEANAKLILRCATLSGHKGKWWTGIRLLGDATKGQYLPHQSSLEIENSVISNAIDAINNGDWVNCYHVPSGALIKVSNSTFINNARDVAMVHYEEYADPFGLTVLPYEAEFKNVRFVKPKVGDPNVGRKAAVTLWGVQNVVFEDCEFIQEEQTIANQQYVNNTAILLKNASINLRDCKFDYFNNAFESYSTVVRHNYSVLERNTFRNNKYGIYCDNEKHISLLKNVFRFPSEAPITMANGAVIAPYGIYLNSSPNSRVEENLILRFPSTPKPTEMSAGIIVNNNGPASDILYKNKFQNLHLGMQFIGNNRSVADDGVIGMQFRCNTFSGVQTDISLPNILDNTAYGIRKNQGDPDPNNPFQTSTNDLAGNFFSKGINHLMDINNLNSSLIHYHHHKTSSHPLVTPTVYTGALAVAYPVNFSVSQSCPTQLIIEPGGDTLAARDYPIAIAEGDYTTYKMDGNSVENTLNTLVDGGNTWELEAELLFAEESEYFELYTDLMNDSPYLSDEILQQIIELENFPHLMLRNILVANPQASKNEFLMELLQEEHPTIPSFMLSDILAGQSTIGGKELLEMELSQYRTKQYRAADYLLTQYASNGDENAETKSRAIYVDLPQAFYQYQLADLETKQEGYTTARQILNDISINNNLSEWEIEEHTKNLDWRIFRLDLVENDLSICDISENEITDLESWSDESNSRGAFARSVLNLLDRSYTYQEPIYLPNTSSGKKEARSTLTPNYRKQNRLFPNPAQTFISIEVNRLSLNEDLMCYIYSLDGRLVKSELLKHEKDIVKLEGLLPGAYLVEVKEGPTHLLREKLIIQ